MLSYDAVTPDSEPERWLLVLHGIYGSGRGWAGVARKLVRARADWGVLLVDLRQHGDSRGFEGPHTIEAAAGDLGPVVEEAGVNAAAVLGHSFGGKVALEYAGQAPAGLEQVWVIDSTPGAGEPHGGPWQMLEVLRALPDVFESRAAAIDGLEERGVARPVARWMATNLEEGDGGYRWRIDPDDMEALLRDFFRRDLWSVVEEPPPGVAIHVVRATRSAVVSDEAAARIEAADRARLHSVEGDHWLNADAPDILARLLSDALPGS